MRKEGRRQKLSSDAAAAVRQDDALLEGRQTNGFPRNNFADAPGARLRRKKERVGMRERQGQRENGGRRRRLPPRWRRLKYSGLGAAVNLRIPQSWRRRKRRKEGHTFPNLECTVYRGRRKGSFEFRRGGCGGTDATASELWTFHNPPALLPPHGSLS